MYQGNVSSSGAKEAVCKHTLRKDAFCLIWAALITRSVIPDKSGKLHALVSSSVKYFIHMLHSSFQFSHPTMLPTNLHLNLYSIQCVLDESDGSEKVILGEDIDRSGHFLFLC